MKTDKENALPACRAETLLRWLLGKRALYCQGLKVGAKSQVSDPKFQLASSATTEKLPKFRFSQIKLCNLCCP